MALTSGQIAEILNGLGQTRAGKALEKRRRAVRVRHRGPVRLVPYADGLPRIELVATLVDFSSRGVAVRFAYAMPSGSHFVLCLPTGAAGGEAVRLLCAVAHADPRPDGLYDIGAEFVGHASDPPPTHPAADSTDSADSTARTDRRAEAARIAGSMFE